MTKPKAKAQPKKPPAVSAKAPAKKRSAAKTQPRKDAKFDTKYRPELIKIAEGMCLMGATDQQIADAFNVTTRTVANWKAAYPDFGEAVQAAKDRADAMVEASLFRSALGYSHPDTVFHVVQGQVIPTHTTKHYPPNQRSIEYWLNNRTGHRQGGGYRTMQRQEVTGANGAPFIINLNADDSAL